MTATGPIGSMTDRQLLAEIRHRSYKRALIESASLQVVCTHHQSVFPRGISSLYEKTRMLRAFLCAPASTPINGE